MRNKKTSEAGFTLIELMVVTVIIAIIATFAYSTYSKSVQKSRRAEGKALLLAAAALQERRIADVGTYATDMEDLGYDTDPAISDNLLYSVAATNANGFTLTATPINRQAVDTQCATMSLNALGVKDSAPSSDCW